MNHVLTSSNQKKTTLTIINYDYPWSTSKHLPINCARPWKKARSAPSMRTTSGRPTMCWWKSYARRENLTVKGGGRLGMAWNLEFLHFFLHDFGCFLLIVGWCFMTFDNVRWFFIYFFGWTSLRTNYFSPARYQGLGLLVWRVSLS